MNYGNCKGQDCNPKCLLSVDDEWDSCTARCKNCDNDIRLLQRSIPTEPGAFVLGLGCQCRVTQIGILDNKPLGEA